MSDDLGGNSAAQLKSIVERIERLNEGKTALSEDISEVKSEAKANGFDIGAINRLIRVRKMDKEKREEQEAIDAMYLKALGML